MLDNQKFDLIIGMHWMKFHKAMLDITPRIIHLNYPFHGPHSLVLCLSPNQNLMIHHLEEKSMENIPVVYELPDVFSDDLPGLPPERGVEFKMELQPGTCPIS